MKIIKIQALFLLLFPIICCGQTNDTIPSFTNDTALFHCVILFSKNQQVIEDFQKSNKLYRKFIFDRINKTENYKDLDSALSYINSAIKLDKRLAVAYYLRALINDAKSPNIKSIPKDYTRAINHRSDYWVFYFQRANYYFYSYEFKNARKDYNKALSLNSNNIVILNQLEFINEEE